MLLKLHKFGNLKKPSDATKTTTCYTNEMSTIVQLFTSDNTLIPTPNFLYMKDEIIKKLFETQGPVLNTISAKSNNQHSSTLNQCSSFLPSNSPNENSHNKKRLASQEQQDQLDEPVLHNCKKYRIPFKCATKDPSKISQWKEYIG